MSGTAAATDSRFGMAEEEYAQARRADGACRRGDDDSRRRAARPCKADGCALIAPCTGNTLAKLAHGITDSAVTMAAKAHLRNGRPLVLAISTNDGLSGSAENIARPLNRKNVYFVPFGQDDPAKKPCSPRRISA